MTNNKINYFVLKKTFNPSLLFKAASLHVEYLSYRSFITMFGTKFIFELYKDILAKDFGFFVFATNGANVYGFVLGCTDSGMLLKIITRNFLKYLKIILPKILVNPLLLFKIFETFFYTKKENSLIKAELIVIVTDQNNRSRGLGSKLVSVLNEEFLKIGIVQYKVTVHSEMTRSNNFYIKNGMHLACSFNMYKVKWNLYENYIIPDTDTIKLKSELMN